MKFPSPRVKNRFRTKTSDGSSILSKCCSSLVHEIRSTRQTVNAILLFLNEHVSPRDSIKTKQAKSDLIEFSKVIESQKESSIGLKWDVTLPATRTYKDTDHETPEIMVYQEGIMKNSKANGPDPTSQSLDRPTNSEKDGHSLIPSRNNNRLLTTLIEEITEPDDSGFVLNGKFRKAEEEFNLGAQSNEGNIDSPRLKGIKSSYGISDGQRFMGSIGKHSGNRKEDESVDRYDKYPVYNNKTGARVYSKEVRKTIESNFSMAIETKKRFFICEIKHDCLRFFNRKDHIDGHIFSYFFRIQCSDCSRKFARPTSLANHLKKYRKKPHSRASVLKCKQPTNEFAWKRSLPAHSIDLTSVNLLPVVELVRLPDFLVGIWH